MRNKEDVISILADSELCPSNLGIGLLDNCCYKGCRICWELALGSKSENKDNSKPVPPPVKTVYIERIDN